MKPLNKTQKVAVCCHVARGVRMEEITEAALHALANQSVHPEDLNESRRLTRLGLADLNPLYEKALVILQDIPESEKKNHLGMNEAEMLKAKQDGKIVYKPIESKDGKAVKTTDGQVYTKGAGGTLKRVGPPKESKKEKRARRKAERIAAGKVR